jgi:hypothetical protein
MKRQILAAVQLASRQVKGHLRVLRLPAALLAIWFAILSGTAPALACASAPVGDCCPDHGSSPCSEDVSKALAPDGAVCCTVVPTPAQATSYSPVRAEFQKAVHFGSPKFSILPVSNFAFEHPAARDDAPLVLASPQARDASLTYLRTQRLRL